MKKQSQTFLHSLKAALNGITYCFRHEKNMKIHGLVTLAALGIGTQLHLTPFEWLFITSAILLVLVTESLNTAIEQLVNMISPEKNATAGLVKDISAGAVLISALYAGIVGASIYGPKLFLLLRR